GQGAWLLLASKATSRPGVWPSGSNVASERARHAGLVDVDQPLARCTLVQAVGLGDAVAGKALGGVRRRHQPEHVAGPARRRDVDVGATAADDLGGHAGNLIT